MVALFALIEDLFARRNIGRLRADGEAGKKGGGKNENLGLHNLLLRLPMDISRARRAAGRPFALLIRRSWAW
jgi:hypothetical protein